jgi:hypothetical protein
MNNRKPRTIVFLVTWSISGLAFAGAPNASWFPQAPRLPKSTAEVIRVRNVEQLYKAAKHVKPGGTISLADGHYLMTHYFEIATDNVTLRSESGNRHKVVLDGATSRHGELVGISNCKGVTIASLTIQNIKWNGFKINSDRGAQRVTIYNCVIHNIWQRGVKAPAVPRDKQATLSPRNCRIQYCLFYNDRPKRFSDDTTDTPKTFNGNYIGGIDAKNTIGWTISDNVFLGINGRTREGRGCIYISENGRDCVIERNIFIDCDIAIALGNPSLGYSPLQAIGCVAKNNFISHCPETGILACYTRDCKVLSNTIHDPKSKRQRLIWVQKSNAGLQVKDNLLVGSPIQITSESKIVQSGNVVRRSLTGAKIAAGQNSLTPAVQAQAIRFESRLRADNVQEVQNEIRPAVVPPRVLAAMQKIHAGFRGQKGYVAQFGDSITYSMAFWSPMSWDQPQRYLTKDDGLPKTPKKMRWRDYVKGARDKGPKFGNYSGWKVGQLLKSMDAVLAREKPEAAIIMIGTNDISGGKVPQSYRDGLQQVIRKCLDVHCVPIVNTIPPRRGHEKAVEEANRIIRDVAKKHHVPLVDFYAECLRRRPDKTWDGTIISKDGVHPSGGKTNVYTADNMKNSGYALRNWVNFLVLRQLHFRVFNPTSSAK